MGRYGQKTGAGWYKYDENRRPPPDPEVDKLIEQVPQRGRHHAAPDQRRGDRRAHASTRWSTKARAFSKKAIALRAVDIDIIYINGYGFPAYRGGPMWYADTVGLKKVYRAHLRVSKQQHGRAVDARAVVEATGRRRQNVRRLAKVAAARRNGRLEDS